MPVLISELYYFSNFYIQQSTIPVIILNFVNNSRLGKCKLFLLSFTLVFAKCSSIIPEWFLSYYIFFLGFVNRKLFLTAYHTKAFPSVKNGKSYL